MQANGVPYAQTLDGNLAEPESAPRAARAYTCLDCGGYLYVKRGKRRIAHFAHYSGAGTNCSPESVMHRAAKRKAAAVLRAGIGEFRLKVPCSGRLDESGNHIKCFRHVDSTLKAPRADTVGEEVAFGPYLLDVAALAADAVVLGIEVFYSHAVNDEKHAYLMAAGIPWFELDASTLLREEMPWKISRSSLGDIQCEQCRAPRPKEPNRPGRVVFRIRDDSQLTERLAAEAELRARAVPVARSDSRVMFPENCVNGSTHTCLLCGGDVKGTKVGGTMVFLHDAGGPCDPRQVWVRAGMLAAYRHLKRSPLDVCTVQPCGSFSWHTTACSRLLRDSLPDFNGVTGHEPCLVLSLDGKPIMRLAFRRVELPADGVPAVFLDAQRVASNPRELWIPRGGRTCDKCSAKRHAEERHQVRPFDGS